MTLDRRKLLIGGGLAAGAAASREPAHAQSQIDWRREADVVVQNDDDSFLPAWDSSRDTYPPPLVPEA